MNHLQILDPIPFEIEPDRLFKTLHIRPGSEDALDFMALAKEAQSFARPKACYKEASIEERGEDWIRIGDQRFQSRILKVNLEETRRVFAFAATCGMELEEWSTTVTDMIWHY